MMMVVKLGEYCLHTFFILGNLCQSLSFLSKELLELDNAPRSVFGEKNVNGTNSHKPGTDKVEVSIYFHTGCI